MGKPVIDWNDERVAELMRLWGEGHSASVIAEMMGLVSRNAVIGKVHRLKLAARPPRTGPAKKARKTTLRPVRRALQVGKMARIPKSPPTERTESVVQPISDVLAPESRNIALLDLQPRDCRYPYGDNPFVFCGHKTSDLRSYCDYHHGITNFTYRRDRIRQTWAPKSRSAMRV